MDHTNNFGSIYYLRPVLNEPSWPEQDVHKNGDDERKGVESIKECFCCSEIAQVALRKFSDSVAAPYLAQVPVVSVSDANQITDTYKDAYATDSQGSGQGPPIAIPWLCLVSFPYIVLQSIHAVQKPDVYTAK